MSPMPDGQSKKDIIDAWREICLESAASQEVGPEYYQWFVNLPDSAILALLELIASDRADEINSWVFAEPRMKSDQDLFDYLETFLEMFGWGLLQVNSDQGIGCCAPLGPLPTQSEHRAIDLRARSARPLFKTAIRNLLACVSKSQPQKELGNPPFPGRRPLNGKRRFDPGL